jgi:hypothetical protein
VKHPLQRPRPWFLLAAYPVTREEHDRLGADSAEFELTGIAISSFLRSANSSLSRTSLFSFRKVRAFSRPCPMRPLPKLIHVPLIELNFERETSYHGGASHWYRL